MQFYTDFSEYSDGSYPDDWSRPWRVGELDVIEDASATGGKLLEHHDSHTNDGHQWDTVGNPEDVEVALKLRGNAGSDPFLRPRAAVRASGGFNTKNGYFAEDLADGSLSRRIFEFTDSSFTELASDSNDPGVNTWFWYRFRANGNDLKFKSWLDSESEPGSWDLETTDQDHSSGWVGLVLGSGQADIDVFCVGTNGDPAPTEPVSADPPSAPTNLQLSEQ